LTRYMLMTSKRCLGGRFEPMGIAGRRWLTQ